MKAFLPRARRYLLHLQREYRRDHCAQAASSLAFGTLLSLVPLVALLAWLALPFDFDLGEFIEPLFEYFTPTPELERVVRANVTRYAENAAALGAVGLGLFLFIAYGMLGAIESVFNDIWRVQARRSGLRRLLRFWAALAVAPLLFLASAAVKSLFALSGLQAHLADDPVAAWVLAWLLPFLLLVSSAAVAYQVLPRQQVRWQAAFTGGLVAGLLYQLVRWLFFYYLGTFAAYDRIYGILGVIPAFLVWLFALWSVLLLGAEVAYTVQYPWDEELPP